MLRFWTARLAASLALLGIAAAPLPARAADDLSLWSAYQDVLRPAKYVDLTHTITPHIPVWAGFAGSAFAPARAGADIERRKAAHGRTPEGAAVFVRSGWSKAWPDSKLGGIGGHARSVAICPPGWPFGVAIGPGDAPLPRPDRPLRFDEASGTRVR